MSRRGVYSSGLTHCAKRTLVGELGGLVCASARCDPPSPARGALWALPCPWCRENPSPPPLDWFRSLDEQKKHPI